MSKSFVRRNLIGLALLVLLLGISGAVSAAPAQTGVEAGGGPVYMDHFHYEDAEVIADFCEESGLTVEHSFALDMFVHAVPHGPDGLYYFLQHGVWQDTYVNQGQTVTAFANVVEKDQFITDNDDGTLTIVILVTGNATAYGPDGKAIARNPGQLRFVIDIDADGNLTYGEVVKESTGRNDSFCDAAVPALTN